MVDAATNLAFSEDDKERGRYPMADGLLDYFPNALAAVAEVSKIGSEKHNVGQPMHHARGKSTDHRNKIMRHLADTGLKDSQGVRHSAYVAWRALALLQEELEAQEGAPLPRGARPAECPVAAATMPELWKPKVGDRVRVLDTAGISPASSVARSWQGEIGFIDEVGVQTFYVQNVQRGRLGFYRRELEKYNG